MNPACEGHESDAPFVQRHHRRRGLRGPAARDAAFLRSRVGPPYPEGVDNRNNYTQYQYH